MVYVFLLNPLSSQPHKIYTHTNRTYTHTNRFVLVCLTILWGWCLKG